MKRLDLTDQQFGRLTVLGPADSKWICKCECGEICVLSTGPLRSGNTKSCGCLKRDRIKEIARRREKNPISIGDQFGELIVIGESDVRTYGSVHWLCKCACGKTKAVRANQLKSGDAKSCGHLDKPNLKGEIFGRLKVIKKASTSTQGRHVKWLCQCVCGNLTQVQTDTLRSGHIVSCGCYRKEVVGLNKRDEGHVAYAIDPEYANKESWIYIVEVGNSVDKIGIAFDMEHRSFNGGYTKVWWLRAMKRADCWAVEQVALLQTRDWKPKEPYHESGKSTGHTEQRTGWVLENVIKNIEKLCDECEEIGWKSLYAKYMNVESLAASQLFAETDFKL